MASQRKVGWCHVKMAGVVQSFLDGHRGWQREGGTTTDGVSLFWKGVTIAHRDTDGHVSVVPIEEDPLQSRATLAVRSCLLSFL